MFVCFCTELIFWAKKSCKLKRNNSENLLGRNSVNKFRNNKREDYNNQRLSKVSILCKMVKNYSKNEDSNDTFDVYHSL